MPITALPPAPLPTDTPSEFNTKSFNLVAALDTFVTETNTVQADVNTKATTATTQAGIATTKANEATTQANLATTNGAAQVALATTQANNASNSASTATTQAGIATTKASEATTQAGIATTKASEATTQADRAYSEAERAEAAADSISSGPVVSVNTKTGVVTLSPTDIAPAATTLEMQTGTETVYRSMSPALVSQAITSLAKSKILRSLRTSNTALTTTDNGKFIDITSGSFTQTFAAAATLGDGWWCYLRNSGTDDITLDPDAAEQIDGLTSYVMYPNEVRLVQCDGVSLSSVVLNAFYKVFTSSGVFNKPPGYQKYGGLLWSAGASGNKGASAVGGAGGGCFPFQISATALLATENAVIGAGGPPSNTATKNPGGNSIFAGIEVVGASAQIANLGGSIKRQGSVNSPITAPSSVAIGFEAASTLTGATSSIYGGGSAVTGVGKEGSSALYGGGSGGGFATTPKVGGSSVFGGKGGDCGDTVSGQNGDAPGGGGGGTNTGAQSGAGARGELRIWGVI